MRGKQRKMMGCPLFVRRLQTKPSQERVVAFFGCLFFDKNKFYDSNFITLKTKPCTKQHNPDRCSQLAARNRTPFAWIMFSAPACNCSPHAGKLWRKVLGGAWAALCRATPSASTSLLPPPTHILMYATRGMTSPNTGAVCSINSLFLTNHRRYHPFPASQSNSTQHTTSIRLVDSLRNDTQQHNIQKAQA